MNVAGILCYNVSSEVRFLKIRLVRNFWPNAKCLCVKQIKASLETDVAQTVAQKFEIGYALHEAIRVGRARARNIPNNPHLRVSG
jgi:hypothetical protein